jgi:hypothetical protein
MASFLEPENVKSIEFYCSHECLWNITSVAYKNKDAPESAYRDIVKSELVASKDVANKIENVRSTYYRELKRMEASRKQVT